MTGYGGWPLTVFMTPDKVPFFAGTYFPKEGFYGRPGLTSGVRIGGNSWNRPRLNEEILHAAFMDLLSEYDEVNGGFGSAPKFPVPHKLLFLMRYYRRTGEKLDPPTLRKDALRQLPAHDGVRKDLRTYRRGDGRISEKGYFYSAEDADSEGEEGKFYTWSLEELDLNLDREGNFYEEATRRKVGRYNIQTFLEAQGEAQTPKR